MSPQQRRTSKPGPGSAGGWRGTVVRNPPDPHPKLGNYKKKKNDIKNVAIDIRFLFCLEVYKEYGAKRK